MDVEGVSARAGLYCLITLDVGMLLAGGLARGGAEYVFRNAGI